jgi:HEAT repeat protein
LGRLFGQTPPPAAVLVTAIAALGRLGTERAARLLVKLERSKEPEVAQAAQRLLDGVGDQTPIEPTSSPDVADGK